MLDYLKRQLAEVISGDFLVFLRKAGNILYKILELPFFVFALPVALGIRIISPLVLIRFGLLISSRMGHFAANPELYLCEKEAGINTPVRRHLDIFYLERIVCNRQILMMWRRVLIILPRLLIHPVHVVIGLIPGGCRHEIGHNSQNDRDIHDLYDRFQPRLSFKKSEIKNGERELAKLGVPAGAPFVCLMVRDSEYLRHLFNGSDLSYHDYRDSDINNYTLAAECIAERGYYVIRMGAKVKKSLASTHPFVIDYATSGKRSDFMDVYLGSRCTFAITVGTGIDAVPVIFRRPIIHVNSVPLGYCYTWGHQTLVLAKHHFKAGLRCSLREIFESGVGFCTNTDGFRSRGIDLVENSPAEIRDISLEFLDRYEGKWIERPEDVELQKRFWELFPTDARDPLKGSRLHGAIRARYGAHYLRDNPSWLA